MQGIDCWAFMSFDCLCVFVSAQQCNPGDLRALRKGMSLYHSESQLSSLPQRQDAMQMVSSQEEQTKPHRTPHKAWEGGPNARSYATFIDQSSWLRFKSKHMHALKFREKHQVSIDRK